MLDLISIISNSFAVNFLGVYMYKSTHFNGTFPALLRLFIHEASKQPQTVLRCTLPAKFSTASHRASDFAVVLLSRFCGYKQSLKIVAHN